MDTIPIPELPLKKIPHALLKVVVITLLGALIGTGAGFGLFFLLLKLSLLHSWYWLIYFIPAGTLSGIAGGIILGVTGGIKYLVIETGFLESVVGSAVSLSLSAVDRVSDSEKVTQNLFSVIDNQIRKLRLKAEKIKEGRGFFLTKFIKSKAYQITADVLFSLTESPEVKGTEFTSKARFMKVVKKVATFYVEESIDELLETPFIIWILATLILILIPVIIGLIL